MKQYQNRKASPVTDELVMFFDNLLQGKNNKLKNRELYIKELFEKNEN